MKQDYLLPRVRFPSDRRRLLSIGLPLLSWTAIVSLVTLFPYDFVLADHRIWDSRMDAFLDGVDIALNILLFAPFGVLLSALFDSASTRWQDVCKFVVPMGLLASLTIELLQQFLPTRDPSFVDVISNTLGVFVGVVAFRAFQGSVLGKSLLRFREHASRGRRFAIVAALAAVLLVISAALQYAGRPINWNHNFFLTLGNEPTKDRPWRGTILALDISDKSPSAQTLHDFARGKQLSEPGNIASLRFPDGNRLPDSVGPIPPLAWVGSAAPPSSSGAQLTEHHWLQTTARANEIADRIRGTDAFAVHLICASADSRQFGPARILSYSADPMQANFMVGQENSNLVFRLRTPSTGSNGLRTALKVPGIFQRAAVRDILITYGQSTINLVVAGSQTIRSLEFGPGSTLALLYLAPRVEHFPYYKIGYYMIIFLIGSGVLAFVIPGTGAYLLACAVWLPVFAFLLEAGLMLAGAKHFDPTNYRLSLLIGCISVIPFCVVGIGQRQPSGSRIAKSTYR
jgi:VanZ family protein